MARRKIRLLTVLTVIVAVATVACAVYIMAHRLGLNPELDFGAGAYYYADIPDFERFAVDDAYKTEVPYWVHVLLFLGWGFLVYRFWVWMDSRDRSKRG